MTRISSVVRTFVAIEISPEVCSGAARFIKQLQTLGDEGVKWADPTHLHWTLKFLGDVDLREIPHVCAAIERATAEMPPFEVEVVGAGAFPDAVRPRTLWLGVGEGEEEMVELHGRVEDELAALGYRRENRKFRPHVTIGRSRARQGAVSQLGKMLVEQREYCAGGMSVDEVGVYSSELQRTGPRYETLGHAELRGDE